MSKATDDFKIFIESDRGERAHYTEVPVDMEIRTPLTRDGFETLVERACKFLDVEVTGPARNVAVGFLHSLPRTVFKTTIQDLAGAIHNALSNHMTYQIDQEIKAEANKELAEENRKLREAQEELAKQAAIEKRQKKLAEKAAKNGKNPAGEVLETWPKDPAGETANEAST